MCKIVFRGGWLLNGRFDLLKSSDGYRGYSIAAAAACFFFPKTDVYMRAHGHTFFPFHAFSGTPHSTSQEKNIQLETSKNIQGIFYRAEPEKSSAWLIIKPLLAGGRDDEIRF
jgi:hypothetical protein